jgi:hypothetical protein
MITGLQATSRDGQLPFFEAGQPLAIQLELLMPTGEQQLEICLTLTALHLGEARVCLAFERQSIVQAPGSDGRCWAELVIPPWTLGTGWYSLAAAVSGSSGSDFFRSRRLVEVVDHPAQRKEKKQTDEIVTQTGEWTVRPGRMPRLPGQARVEQLRIQQGCEEPLVLAGELPVRIVTRLQMAGLPRHRPVLRLQIYSQARELLLETDTDRWGLDLGSRPTVAIEIDYEHLSLPPGRYTLALGVWPDARSTDPCEERDLSHTLLVGGGEV